MAEAKQYTGGCHCKKVRFQTTVSLEQIIECNCSICSQVAALRAFTTASQFELLSGADCLTDYQFGKQHLHHTFCKMCGVHSFASGKAPDGTQMYAINARCLDGVDVPALEVTHYDGRKL
jgi:hypothetical protein